jgi:hypothetical protein
MSTPNGVTNGVIPRRHPNGVISTVSAQRRCLTGPALRAYALARCRGGGSTATDETKNWPTEAVLPNNRMQLTAPRVGRAGNGVVDAAAACSLTLAPAPQLIRVLCGSRTDDGPQGWNRRDWRVA